MAYSTQRVVSDGTLALLSVSIGYLERAHIHVIFDNVEDALPWAWVGETNQISFSPAVPNGVEVVVARRTDLADLYHVFSQGAQFTADTLDEGMYQILYIAQEATEGNLGGDFFQDINMHGSRITNLAPAVGNTDAMQYGQFLDAVAPFANAAAASAAAADASADAALASETAAAVSAANAATAAILEVNNGNTNAVLKTSSTGSVKIPSGTTAQRDVSPEYGAQRANSTLNKQEWWDGSSWVSLADTGTFLAVAGGNQMLAPLVFDTSDHAVIKVGSTSVVSMSSANGLPFMKNKLINGEVTRINQRGVANWAAVANGAYGYDRWKKVDASNMTQIIEAGNFRPNTVHTLSGVGVTTQQITSPASGNWTLPNIPIAATNVQVEEGLEATPFEVRHVGFELGLCQRYYQNITALMNGNIITGGYLGMTVYFPNQMRAIPTVTEFSNTSSNVGTIAYYPAINNLIVQAPGIAVANAYFNVSASLSAEL